MPWRCAPAERSSGKVSRSTETGRPVGIESITERLKTYAPALIWSVTISSGVCGFSRKAVTRPVGVRGDQAEGARVLDQGEVERDVRAGGGVGRDEGLDVQAREDVPVEDEDRLVGARVQSRGDVAYRAAGAEGLLLGDVLQAQAEVRAVTEVGLEDLGQVGGGEHDVLHAGGAGPGQLMGQEGDARRRDHGLGRVDREGSQPRALATDQEDRFCHLVVSASCSGPAGSPVSVVRAI
ncbi:hypothetical protein STANM309S_00859 [Streptomyces tanashiensis]